MARLNLTAEGQNQNIVLAYLEENASDSLAERINGGKKTMRDCWNYITQQARKRATNNCACIEDREVFGWAIHFFEEDDIKAEPAKKDEVNPKIHERYVKNLEEQAKKQKEEEERKKAAKEAERKAAEEQKAKERQDRKNVPGQLDMFSLLGGM